MPVRPPWNRESHKRLHTEQRPPPTIQQAHYQPPWQETPEEYEARERDGPKLSKATTDHQFRLDSPVDKLREAFQIDYSPRSWNNDVRLAVYQAMEGKERPRRQEEEQYEHLKRVTNEDPAVLASHTNSIDPYKPKGRPFMPTFPLNGGLLDHNTFRQAMASVSYTSPGGFKPIRRLMREQLLRCQLPSEILRVLAVAMQRRETAMQMPWMGVPFVRALYRSRNNVNDARILSTVTVIIDRLKKAKLDVHPELLNMGLKFAARARSLSGMKRYLLEFRECNGRIPPEVFRTLIAKFSIGTRGLGEIRNGRWRRQELLQVLLGFEGTLPAQAHHLETFLVRDDWQYLHGWLCVLARCKAVDALWTEWEHWLKCPLRVNPKPIAGVGRAVTTKVRGDYWLVEQMCYAGGIKQAWEILQVTGLGFNTMKPSMKNILLSHPEYAKEMTDDLRNSLLDKYAHELSKIEETLNARWVSTGPDGSGYHVLEGDLEDMLYRLGNSEIPKPANHGYPWDSDPAEALNEADAIP